ncbi:MAG TPA: M55 family metallopeptidase [Thermomicrobiales bacterium]|nr:M55 family metallopeptidase [Thermomicrobiales bacterium]
MSGTTGRVLILGDIEGIVGVDDWRQIFSSHAGYGDACRDYAEDVNATVRGLRASGATEVLLVDTHAAGTNLAGQELIGCRAFEEPSILGRIDAAIDEGVDALILLGFHAAAGTTDGFVPHSFAPATRSWIDGDLAGEPAFYALMADARGVPTILITGDAQTIAQLSPFVPGALFVQTKTSHSPWSTTSMERTAARDAIERTAADAYRGRISIVPPLRPTMTLTIETQNDVAARLIAGIPGFAQVDAGTAEFNGRWAELWRAFVTANSLAALSAAVGGSWYFGPIEGSLVERLTHAAGTQAAAQASGGYFAAQFSPPWGPACPPEAMP